MPCVNTVIMLVTHMLLLTVVYNACHVLTLSLCTFRSFVKSRHFWLWTKSIFAELCGEKISQADSTALEEGLDITRDFMRTYVKSSLHPIA